MTTELESHRRVKNAEAASSQADDVLHDAGEGVDHSAQLRALVTELLADSPNFQDFLEQLHASGVALDARIGRRGKITQLSYHYSGQVFDAKRLGKELSWESIHRQLGSDYAAIADFLHIAAAKQADTSGAEGGVVRFVNHRLNRLEKRIERTQERWLDRGEQFQQALATLENGVNALREAVITAGEAYQELLPEHFVELQQRLAAAEAAVTEVITANVSDLMSRHFTQWEQSSAARHESATAQAEAAHRSLKQLGKDLAEFRRFLEQQVDQSHRVLNDRFNAAEQVSRDTGERITACLDQHQQAGQRRLREHTEALEARLDELAGHLEAARSALSTEQAHHHHDLTEQLEALAKVVGEQHQIVDSRARQYQSELHERLAALADHLARMEGRVTEGHRDTAEDFSRLRRSLSEAAAGLEKNLDQQAGELRAVSEQHTRSLAERLSELDRALAQAQAALADQSRQGVDTVRESLTELGRAFAERAEQLRQAVTELSGSQTDRFDNLNVVLEHLIGGVQERADAAHRTTLERLSQLDDGNEALRQALGATAERVDAHVKALHDQASEHARQTASRLSDLLVVIGEAQAALEQCGGQRHGEVLTALETLRRQGDTRGNLVEKLLHELGVAQDQRAQELARLLTEAADRYQHSAGQRQEQTVRYLETIEQQIGRAREDLAALDRHVAEGFAALQASFGERAEALRDHVSQTVEQWSQYLLHQWRQDTETARQRAVEQHEVVRSDLVQIHDSVMDWGGSLERSGRQSAEAMQVQLAALHERVEHLQAVVADVEKNTSFGPISTDRLREVTAMLVALDADLRRQDKIHGEGCLREELEKLRNAMQRLDPDAAPLADQLETMKRVVPKAIGEIVETMGRTQRDFDVTGKRLFVATHRMKKDLFALSFCAAVLAALAAAFFTGMLIAERSAQEVTAMKADILQELDDKIANDPLRQYFEEFLQKRRGAP